MAYPYPNEVRQRRKDAIEDALKDGFAPPGMSGPKGGAIAEAGKRLGQNRSTIASFIDNETSRLNRGEQHFLPDWSLYKAPTPIERVEDEIEIRDTAFWRRKAHAAEKRATEIENALRQIAGISYREIKVPEWTLPANDAKGGAIGLIHLSDLHAGEVVRPEEIGGINEYNPDIFKKRFRRMIDASCRILPRWSSDCTLKGVVAAVNGDGISGDIHAELRESNALTSHEQVALVTDEIAAGLHKLADQFGAVMATFTPGNHGRSTEKTHAKRMAALSYDTMIGNILAREFSGDSRIEINVSAGPDLVFPLFRWLVLQTHGDSMGTGGGQGFAGPELPIVRGGKKIKLSGFAVGDHYDITLTAHYHTSSNPGTMLANGSMVGFNEYAQRIRAIPEPPMQWLALVHEKWGLRERMPIVLEDPKEPTKPRIRVPVGMA